MLTNLHISRPFQLAGATTVPPMGSLKNSKRLHAQDHIFPIQYLAEDHVFPIQPLLGKNSGGPPGNRAIRFPWLKWFVQMDDYG